MRSSREDRCNPDPNMLKPADEGGLANIHQEMGNRCASGKPHHSPPPTEPRKRFLRDGVTCARR